MKIQKKKIKNQKNKKKNHTQLWKTYLSESK